VGEEKKLELPANGYDIVEKILHAYALCGDKAVTLDEVSGRAGMHKTQVSRSNGFLVSVGIIEGGKKKKLTPQGKALALAIGNKLADDVTREWKKLLESCEGTRSIIDMIRVQGSMSKDTLLGKTASILGLVDTGTTRTGMNCLIEILQQSGLLSESDGTYSLSEAAKRADAHGEPAEQAVAPPKQTAPAGAASIAPPVVQARPLAPPNVPTVHIDIQVHIDASASPEQIDQIFASMAKHLYGKDNQ